MPRVLPGAPSARGVEEVHLRRADEAGDEGVGGVVVELHRGADLLDAAGVEDDDAVGERHRLDLVVGDVDHRRRELAVQAGDLDAGGDAQRGVEVGEGLVEEEELRRAHDGAADGDALALAAGELGRAAGEERARARASARRRRRARDEASGWRRPA